MDALAYMEDTEECPESRDTQRIFDLLDERYGRTDTEKAWMRLSQFNDFNRNLSAHGHFKEFWARYQRTITKLKSLGMDMSEDMTFHKAIQALKLPDGQLPIVLAALKTSGEATSLKALRELTIKMYETHKSSGDATEVYHAQLESTPTISNDTEEEEAESEWEITDESGQTFLMRPKKKIKSRNAPGAAEAARRGAMANFKGTPNYKSKGKGKSPLAGPCLRCGDPNHHYRDCPLPWKEVLDTPATKQWRPVSKGKGKGKGKNILYAEQEESCTQGCPGLEHTETPTEGTTIPTDAVEPCNESPESYDDVDGWWEQYYTVGDAPTMVCTTISTYKTENHKLNGHDLNDKSPLMLLDSGAALTVTGEKWLQWWNPNHGPLEKSESVNFRFGAGPERPSQGSCILFITLPPEVTNQASAQTLQLRVHVVKENIPLLISRESLAKLQATLNFRDSTLVIKERMIIQLCRTPSGHLMLPGRRGESRSRNHVFEGDTILGNQVYAAVLDVPLPELSKEELKKLHLNLGHCSEHTLITMLRAAHISIPTEAIEQLYKECNCQAGVHRITAPNVSCWMSKYNGEVVGIDICYPFLESHPEVQGGKSPALIMVDSLSRYVNCSLIGKLTGENVLQTFLNDWVRPLGKPRRILMDNGGPGFKNKAWTDASGIFGWQIVMAPPQTQSQNGLA